MDARNDEKAETLLQIIGVGDQLAVLDRQEKSLYNQRLEVGRIADRKKKNMRKKWPGIPMPAEPVSASEGSSRDSRPSWQRMEKTSASGKRSPLQQGTGEAQIAFDRAKAALKQAEQDCVTARKAAENLQDESTAELEQDIANIDAINTKVRANAEKNRVQAEPMKLAGQYGDLTQQIESVKEQRMKLLDSADMPLPGLSVQDGELRITDRSGTA